MFRSREWTFLPKQLFQKWFNFSDVVNVTNNYPIEEHYSHKVYTFCRWPRESNCNRLKSKQFLYCRGVDWEASIFFFECLIRLNRFHLGFALYHWRTYKNFSLHKISWCYVYGVKPQCIHILSDIIHVTFFNKTN